MNAYEEFINNILESRGRFACENKYHERHHIIPKCIGGTDDECNLIDLFAREHFEAHRLLALENPDNDRLIYAWWMMSHIGNAEVTCDEYEEAKGAFSSTISKKHKGKNNPMYGKLHSEETKRKMSELRKGTNAPWYGKHMPYEICQKISERKKGKPSPNKGKQISEEQKEKISKSKKGRYCGKDNPKSKRVAQYDKNGNLIKIWDCIRQATNELNICSSCIVCCCQGKQKTSGGFVWRYYTDV